MTLQVIAVIPARSGSKGIKDKNIQLINTHPLISYSIAVAKLSLSIEDVFVSLKIMFSFSSSSRYFS